MFVFFVFFIGRLHTLGSNLIKLLYKEISTMDARLLILTLKTLGLKYDLNYFETHILNLFIK